MRSNFSVYIDAKRRKANDCFIIALSALFKIPYREALILGMQCGWKKDGVRLSAIQRNIRAVFPAFNVVFQEWAGKESPATLGHINLRGRGILFMYGHCTAYGPETIYEGAIYRPKRRVTRRLNFRMKTTAPQGANTYGFTPQIFNV